MLCATPPAGASAAGDELTGVAAGASTVDAVVGCPCLKMWSTSTRYTSPPIAMTIANNPASAAPVVFFFSAPLAPRAIEDSIARTSPMADSENSASSERMIWSVFPIPDPWGWGRRLPCGAVS